MSEENTTDNPQTCEENSNPKSKENENGFGISKLTLQEKPRNYYKKPSRGIAKICQLLNELQVTYSQEVKFGAACHHWKPLPFDIQVVMKGGRIGLIEYDGAQHFYYGYNTFTKTKEDLINQQTRDILKTLFCKKHSISLLKISYDATDGEIQYHLTHFLECLNRKTGEAAYVFSNPKLYCDHIKLCLP